MTNKHPVPKKPVLAAKMGGLVKRMFQDGFVKYSRSRLANPEERGVLFVRRNDEGYA